MRRHWFIHHCASGNECCMTAVIPRAGERLGFEILWERPPSKPDRAERSRWLDSTVKAASEIAGRDLVVIFDDQMITATPEKVYEKS